LELWQHVEEMMRKPHRKGTTMSSEDDKAVTLRLYAAIGEVYRTGDSGLLDPLLAPDMIDHTPASGLIMGREPGKQLIASFARLSRDDVERRSYGRGSRLRGGVCLVSQHTQAHSWDIHPLENRCTSRAWILCATVMGK
jgi:hypothetical protein